MTFVHFGCSEGNSKRLIKLTTQLNVRNCPKLQTLGIWTNIRLITNRCKVFFIIYFEICIFLPANPSKNWSNFLHISLFSMNKRKYVWKPSKPLLSSWPYKRFHEINLLDIYWNTHNFNLVQYSSHGYFYDNNVLTYEKLNYKATHLYGFCVYLLEWQSDTP